MKEENVVNKDTVYLATNICMGFQNFVLEKDIPDTSATATTQKQVQIQLNNNECMII